MIKKTSAFALILMFVFLTGYTVPALKVYSNKAAGFSIDMPAGESPQYSSQQVKTDSGNLTLHTFIVSTNEAAYMVAYSDFPKSLIKSKGVEKLLSDTYTGAANSMKGSVENVKAIKIPGADVKEVLLKGAEFSSRARYYLVGNRMYQMVFITSSMDAIKSNKKDLNKFFDSFKLIK